MPKSQPVSVDTQQRDAAKCSGEIFILGGEEATNMADVSWSPSKIRERDVYAANAGGQRTQKLYEQNYFDMFTQVKCSKKLLK